MTIGIPKAEAQEEMTSKWGDMDDEETGDRRTGVGRTLTVDELRAATGALNGVQALFARGGATTRKVEATTIEAIRMIAGAAAPSLGLGGGVERNHPKATECRRKKMDFPPDIDEVVGSGQVCLALVTCLATPSEMEAMDNAIQKASAFMTNGGLKDILQSGGRYHESGMEKLRTCTSIERAMTKITIGEVEKKLSTIRSGDSRNGVGCNEITAQFAEFGEMVVELLESGKEKGATLSKQENDEQMSRVGALLSGTYEQTLHGEGGLCRVPRHDDLADSGKNGFLASVADLGNQRRMTEQAASFFESYQRHRERVGDIEARGPRFENWLIDNHYSLSQSDQWKKATGDEDAGTKQGGILGEMTVDALDLEFLEEMHKSSSHRDPGDVSRGVTNDPVSSGTRYGARRKLESGAEGSVTSAEEAKASGDADDGGQVGAGGDTPGRPNAGVSKGHSLVSMTPYSDKNQRLVQVAEKVLNDKDLVRDIGSLIAGIIAMGQALSKFRAKADRNQQDAIADRYLHKCEELSAILTSKHRSRQQFCVIFKLMTEISFSDEGKKAAVECGVIIREIMNGFRSWRTSDAGMLSLPLRNLRCPVLMSAVCKSGEEGGIDRYGAKVDRVTSFTHIHLLAIYDHFGGEKRQRDADQLKTVFRESQPPGNKWNNSVSESKVPSRPRRNHRVRSAVGAGGSLSDTRLPNGRRGEFRNVSTSERRQDGKAPLGKTIHPSILRGAGGNRYDAREPTHRSVKLNHMEGKTRMSLIDTYGPDVVVECKYCGCKNHENGCAIKTPSQGNKGFIKGKRDCETSTYTWQCYYLHHDQKIRICMNCRTFCGNARGRCQSKAVTGETMKESLALVGCDGRNLVATKQRPRGADLAAAKGKVGKPTHGTSNGTQGAYRKDRIGAPARGKRKPMGMHRSRRLQAVPIGGKTSLDDRRHELNVRMIACAEYQERCKSLLGEISECIDEGDTLVPISEEPEVGQEVNSDFTKGLVGISAECEEKLHHHLMETKLSDTNSGWMGEPGEMCRRMATCQIGEELEARVRSTIKEGSGDTNREVYESISEATCGKLMEHLIFEVGERAQYVHRIILKKFSGQGDQTLRKHIDDGTLNEIIGQAMSASHDLRVVEGDMLLGEDLVVGIIANTSGNDPGGLAEIIEGIYPESGPPGGIRGNAHLYMAGTSYIGQIEDGGTERNPIGYVAYLIAQRIPGKTIGVEGSEERYRLFKSALSDLYNQLDNRGLTTLGLPYKIGCTEKDGGDWRHYGHLISYEAALHPEVTDYLVSDGYQ